jgi:hypothetical protein
LTFEFEILLCGIFITALKEIDTEVIRRNVADAGTWIWNLVVRGWQIAEGGGYTVL